MTQQAEILPMETGKVAIYNPFRSQLAELEKQNNSLIFDYESPAGNKEARSHIYKLRKTKAAVEDARKKEKQESLEYGRTVDAEAKEISAKLEAMIDVHQKMVDEIENREKARIEAIQARIANIACYQECAGHDTEETTCAIARLKSMVIDGSFGEFEAEARKQWDLALKAQEVEHAAAHKREADARELDRLRKEAAERAQRDHEEKIRSEAAEKAKAEAQAKAQAEREATARMAAEIAAAAERRELELKSAAERAEREKLEAVQAKKAAEEKAKADALEAEARAKREAEAAVQRERERAEAERKAEAEAASRREADKAHRAKINNEALAVISKLTGEDLDEKESCARKIIEAIAKGHVPHIKISY